MYIYNFNIYFYMKSININVLPISNFLQRLHIHTALILITII